MSNSEDSELTDLARFFLEPSNTTHRQYEALRAYFVEHLPSAEAARRFGYTPGSFRVLCHEFRRNPRRPFLPLPRQKPTGCPEERASAGDHCVLAQAESLDLRHQPSVEAERTDSQPTSCRYDFETGGICPAPQAARRRAPSRHASPYCRRGQCQRVGSDSQAVSYQVRGTVSFHALLSRGAFGRDIP